MHTLYILKGKETNKFYTGTTSDLKQRLDAHSQGKTSFGKRNKNIFLVYSKQMQTLSAARKLESFIKRQKSHGFIEKFISGKITIPR